ncbi:hypothetical protein NDU88_010816 [Pleurodeles waltl]|uniref:Uncharacterized protein n=1 Tax=Pleurodeles waltl TaxID=8319 RepID=A0AAV7S2A6_PLEWA|nr:hypothetical protein NDU88_010816 [Pleurodeles waltl]
MDQAHAGAFLRYSLFSPRTGWQLNRRWQSGRRLNLGSAVLLVGPPSLFSQPPVTGTVQETVPQFTPPQAPPICPTSIRVFAGTPCVYGAPLVIIFTGYCLGPAWSSFASVLCDRHLGHAPYLKYT